MPLIVTHKAPDLDAIGSVWLLTRFDAQHYAGSRLAFTPSGTSLSDKDTAALGYSPEQVTHVDTGGGHFDHHDPARAGRDISATKLVYDHIIKIHPEHTNNQALAFITNHILEGDHFGEIYWPDPAHPRYLFMLSSIIGGIDRTETNDDSYQVELGARLLDYIYASAKNYYSALDEIKNGQIFPLKQGSAIALETSNDQALTLAQKQGHFLAIKKDPKAGHIRIKARPDAPFDLNGLHQEILALDQTGTWYNHPSGKMLLNGSYKNPNHTASPLTLQQIIQVVQKVLG